MPSNLSEGEYRKLAKEQFHADGEIEIDDNCKVSLIDDPESENGAYVTAWVWVADPEK